MVSKSLAQPSISPKAMSTQRLRGLISVMIQESGLDQESFKPMSVLLRAIDNPSMHSICLELTQQENGWTLSAADLRPYAAGAPTIRQRSDN